jgi:diguanylate cyclase (GGDEF)-like protein
LVVLHDITERQLAKLALQNTNIELERRVQERTAQLEETNEKLRASALHDPLTGLPNRRLFMDRLDHAFVRTRRHPGQATAVLFMDLDHFKSVNDNLGHSRGDILLHLIAGRLKSCMRTGDTVARIGGDEFVILLEDIQDASEAVQIAGRLQLELAQPADLDGHEVFTSASIGVALASARHRVPEEILRDADLAMYRAKAKGRGRCETFTPAEFASKQNLLELQVDLGPALEQREFELHYQPIIDLRSGEVVSVEALLRWNHPIFGILYPNQFLQQAEESGWIAPIGEWVLREACAQAKDWHSAGHDRLRVAVNISMRQFFELELRDLVPRVAAETGLHPQFLEVEISERTAMEDLNYSMDTLAELSRIGVQISIDNFGEANNTLEHLNRLPTNSLKIDRAFGIDGRNQLHRASIVPEIIERAHSRRLCIVGKRVETRQQLAALASQDYDQIQGYLISQAVPANRAADLFGVSQREAFLTLSETPEINHR